MRRLVQSCIVSALVVVLFGSCSETKEIGPDILGYDFYPLEIGQYRIYEVEEINYLVAGFDTCRYQLRETIFDSIQSINQTTYLIRREVRSSSTEEWISDSLWTVANRGNFLTVTENNVPFMKLVFPATLGRSWDGNSLNTRPALTYYYQELEMPLIDSLTAGDHIRLVIEDEEENVTGVDLRSEVYARGVGLVLKDYLTQTKCTASGCGAELGEVIGGRSLRQVLIELGDE